MPDNIRQTAKKIKMTKFIDIDKLVKILKQKRKQRKKIVFTNGCFDILHKGHVAYLEKAKRYGDILVIGLNSDSSIRRLKGPKRPIFPERERAEVLSALSCVDYVAMFNENTPLNLIKKIQPDVLIKGGDYTLDTIVGRDFLESYGGKVVTIPLIKGKSTSDIINKIKNS
ncbi:MAG: D-glycero-beta-D-manno-heptose 1-phosphate adenylyltransferase [Elusimicrobiota bacterium]